MSDTQLPTVLLDTSRLAGRFVKGRRATGVDRVCLAYQNRYRGIAKAVVGAGARQRIVSRWASQRLFDMLGSAADSAHASQTWAGRIDRAARLAAILAPSLWARGGGGPSLLMINVGHNGVDQPGYARWLACGAATPVFMVHDLIPITHAEFARPNERVRHQHRIRTMLRTAGGLVLNSRATLDALHRHANDERIAMPPTVVSPLGVDLHGRDFGGGAAAEPPLPGRRAGDAGRPYFVMLGTIEARKNHWFVLQLWRRLVEALGDGAPQLVIIGQRGWEAEGANDMLERCESLRGVVIERSSCADAELAGWLGHAHGLLFPSFAEGFGLPLAESLAFGTPVIASDLPVFREIADECSGAAPGVRYVDPLDGIGWMQAVLAQARLPQAALAAQRQQIRRTFRPPTWDQHFGLVDDFLDRVRRLPLRIRP